MNIVHIIAPIFGIIGLGWVARRFNVLKARISTSFNNFVYYFALPFLILRGILDLKIDQLLNMPLLITNVLAMAVLTVAAILIGVILQLKKKEIAMFSVAAYFGTVAYMGIPFNELAFGHEGGSIASLIAVIAITFAVLFGLTILKVVTNKKEFHPAEAILGVIKLPIIWATVVGLVIIFYGISLPVAAHTFIDLLARLAGPLALFSLGMFVCENKFGGNLKIIILLAIFNLLALPLTIFVTGGIFGLSGLPLKISIIQGGMPIAITTFVFSRKFHVEEKDISEAIVITVLIAPFTLSLLLWLVGKM